MDEKAPAMANLPSWSFPKTRFFGLSSTLKGFQGGQSEKYTQAKKMETLKMGVELILEEKKRRKETCK